MNVNGGQQNGVFDIGISERLYEWTSEREKESLFLTNSVAPACLGEGVRRGFIVATTTCDLDRSFARSLVIPTSTFLVEFPLWMVLRTQIDCGSFAQSSRLGSRGYIQDVQKPRLLPVQ